jgi:hypothetical protein
VFFWVLAIEKAISLLRQQAVVGVKKSVEQFFMNNWEKLTVSFPSRGAIA